MLNRNICLTICVLLSIVTSCQKKENTTNSEQPQLEWKAIADKLIKQSNLQSGEHVLLVAAPGRFDSLVSILENKISREGAVFLGTISVDSANQPQAWETDFVRDTRGKSRSDLADMFAEIDLGIMLPGATPDDVAYAALQDVLKMGRARTIHFHWSGAYDMSGQPIEVDAQIEKLYQSVLLETKYDTLAALQRRFEKAIRTSDVLVTTPAGTNITFKIGDRQVTKQDGDASLAQTQDAKNLIDREVELPAGAIRVAPIEETVNGTIAFPDGMWNGQKVEGLVLAFKKGKVTSITAKTGQDAVKAELDAAGDAGHSFRELAVGFNPLLAIPKEKPWIPYYGYGAGIVRLSLGDNSELGGKVKGDYVRWNFFVDATLTVGNDIWIRDGVLLQ